MTDIKDNIEKVELQISSACKIANRQRNEVTLLVVSKKQSHELIKQVYAQGQRHFGESYVQEAINKIAALSEYPDICWHFIGPIQSNKTNLIAENFSWVHSIDREKIATRLNKQRAGKNTPLNVCLQVNISNEKSKSGVNINELPQLLDLINHLDNLTLRGLMAIPEKNAPLKSFITMQALFFKYKTQYPSMDTLSMGMSADLTFAINAGSTMVRIGTAIFGERSI